MKHLRLISNDITVSEQFHLMKQFEDTIQDAWIKSKPTNSKDVDAKAEFVEKEFGIRCEVIRNSMGERLVCPRVVDDKKVLFFYMKLKG